jgi:hypothetical protein
VTGIDVYTRHSGLAEQWRTIRGDRPQAGPQLGALGNQLFGQSGNNRRAPASRLSIRRGTIRR